MIDRSPQELIEWLDAIILAGIKEADADRWRELRAREEDPITLGELAEIAAWMIEPHEPQIAAEIRTIPQHITTQVVR